MANKSEDPQVPLIHFRPSPLKENVLRVNKLLFKRGSHPTISVTNRENETENIPIRVRKTHALPVHPDRSHSPQSELINSARGPSSSLIDNRSKSVLRKSRDTSPSPLDSAQNLLKRRSNTIENLKLGSNIPDIAKKDLKRQQSSERNGRESRIVSSSRKPPLTLSDNLMEKVRQRMLDNREGNTDNDFVMSPLEKRQVQTDRSVGLSTLRSIENMARRTPAKNIHIREKRSLHQSVEKQDSAELQTRLSTLIKASKVDFSEDRKEIRQLINDHKKDMDEITLKHFKPNIKKRWELVILGKPPEVKFTRLYSCTKPGFLFYKKKFMTSDQEV